jgi:16S rRNA G966 N2-methylase RsmD
LKLKINPEYETFVPYQSAQEYKELKENIKQFGQHIPIVYNNRDEILDGHHRFKVCTELGIEPKIEVNPRTFETIDHEKLFVIDCNLQRRQLTDYVRAVLALKSKPMLERIVKKNMSDAGKGVLINTPLDRVNQEIGKRARLGETTIRKVEVIQQFGTEKQKKQLEVGVNKVSINSVFNDIQKDIKREEMEIEASNPNVDLPENGDYELYNRDFRSPEMDSNIPDESIDLIFTDPPYGQEAVPLYGDLAEFASRKLKDGGSLVTYTGQLTLDKVMQVMGKHLDYWWIISIKLGGAHQAVHPRKVFVEWKPLLWFVKKGQKPNILEYLSDHIDSKPVDKIAHEWEQSVVEANHIIKRLTIENQIVLDPFMGTGTTGKSALSLDRKFIGIEIDKETFARVNLN